MRAWIRIAVVALLVLSSVAAPAVAQVDNDTDGPELPDGGDLEDVGSDTDDEDVGEENSTDNATDTPESNETDEEDGEDDGGLFGGGGLMPSMPTAGEWLESALEWLEEDVSAGVEGYVDRLNSVFVGIAAPGEPTSPSSWVMPEEGMWGVAAAFYVAAASMGSVLWAAGFVYVFDIKSRQKQREVLRLLIYSALGTLFGMVLLGLYFNGTNIVVRGIAPSGTDFVQSGGGLAQLGLGHVIAAVLVIVNAGVVVLGGLIMFGIYLLPIVLFAFFPFIIAAKAVPVKPLQSIANLGLTTLALLPVLRIIQSLLLRLAHMLTFEGTGLGEQIASLLGTAIILTIALLVLPYIFYKNIETASGMALSTITVRRANQGASRVNNAATSAGSRAKSRVASAAAPYADKARSAANQTAANAKFQAGSRAGGALLTAKFGRPGHQTPAQAANSTSPTGGSASSSASSNTDTRAQMPAQAANQSRTARTRAINRQRRDARKRRSARGD